MEILRPGAACPTCRILYNSGRCPKCGKKQAHTTSLAGKGARRSKP